MYAYVKYYKAKGASLIYPGEKLDYKRGHFIDEEIRDEYKSECGSMIIEINPEIRQWQKQIAEVVFNFKPE